MNVLNGKHAEIMVMFAFYNYDKEAKSIKLKWTESRWFNNYNILENNPWCQCLSANVNGKDCQIVFKGAVQRGILQIKYKNTLLPLPIYIRQSNEPRIYSER